MQPSKKNITRASLGDQINDQNKKRSVLDDKDEGNWGRMEQRKNSKLEKLLDSTFTCGIIYLP